MSVCKNMSALFLCSIHANPEMNSDACRYLGQQNPTDMFTRLLASLVYTGLAPQSFYKEPNGPDRHYDGM